MLVAAFQFDVRRGAVEANLAEVESGLREAARAGVRLVCLPEMWPTSFCDVEPGILAASAAALARVRQLAGELGLLVCGSAFGEAGGGRPTNRLHVLDGGREILGYDKVHLFSPTAEAESFSAGAEPPATVTTDLGALSGVVCYDLRFGRLLRVPYLAGAEVLVVPAQWPTPRASHWRALVLGRAVEAQAFVVACNRLGTDLVGRRRLELVFPGNSLIADPHGRALAEGDGRRGLVVARLDLSEARRLRARVPVRRDERPELYAGWEGAG